MIRSPDLHWPSRELGILSPNLATADSQRTLRTSIRTLPIENSDGRYCTTRVTVPVSLTPPEVPVSVMVYVPAVVPGVPPPPAPPLLLPPLPQARTPPLRVTISASNPSIVCHLRRCVGMPKISMQAKVAPLIMYQAALGPLR